MTDASRVEIPDAGVLSNRQKCQHGDGRGLHSLNVQTEQIKVHDANRLDDGEA